MKRSVLAIALIAIGIVGWGIAIFSNGHGKMVDVTIVPGASAGSVASLLESKGVISCGACYRLYGLLNSAVERPKAGAFQLPAKASYAELARLIALGPAREEANVRIQEGWDMVELSSALEKFGVASTTARSAAVSDRFPDSAIALSLPKGSSLEGYLYPETYRVYKDQLPEGLYAKQLATFETKMKDAMVEAKATGKNFHEILTLASIIEREVPNSADRKIISGIFWNRLKIGMPLQSDATVNYVTRGYRSRPTTEDLKILSPYNTYQQRGLPPGPIGNPTADAVDAVLHPTASDNLYFLTDPHGKLYVAKTHEEHVRNKLKAFQSP